MPDAQKWRIPKRTEAERAEQFRRDHAVVRGGASKPEEKEMNEGLAFIVGKTVASVEDSACNIKTVIFTDGTKMEMEAVLVCSCPLMYGVCIRYPELPHQ